MNSDIVSLIIILICVMLSAYFSATETSFHLAEPHPHEKYGRKRRQAGGTGVKVAGEL